MIGKTDELEPLGAVTEGEVHSACFAVLAGGNFPTVKRLQAYLGRTENRERGSASTVNKYQRTWLAHIKETGNFTLPSPLPEQALEPILQMWALVKGVAWSELEGKEKEMRELVAEADSARRQAEDEAAASRDVVEAIESEIRQLRAVSEEKTDRLNEQAATINAQQISIERLQSQLGLVQDEHRGAIARMEAEYSRERMEVERANSEALAAKQAEVERLAVSAEEIKKQVAFERDRSTAETERWMMEVDRARQEVVSKKEAWSAEKKRLEAEINISGNRADQALAELSKLKDVYYELREKYSQLKSEYGDLECAHEALKEEVNKNDSQ